MPHPNGPLKTRADNAKTLPKVYYGLHMTEGLAQYDDEDGGSYKVAILENTIKKMDRTFAGKPVYVQHVDKVDLENLQEEADGYVIESFYNKSDGKHWAKFIVVSDAGHEAIRNGWKLSNAYWPLELGPGGSWHNIQYRQEVLEGEYEHLAIVDDPRYEESKILTPEQFRAYNAQKEAELRECSVMLNSTSTAGAANDVGGIPGLETTAAMGPNPGYEVECTNCSWRGPIGSARHYAGVLTCPRCKQKVKKAPEPARSNRKDEGGHRMPLNLFKRQKVEKPGEFEGLCVTLKNGRDMTIQQVVNAYEQAMDAPAPTAGSVDLAQKVTVGDTEMTIEELIEKYLEASKPSSEEDPEDKLEQSEGEDDDSREKAKSEDKGKVETKPKDKEKVVGNSKKLAEREQAKKTLEEREKREEESDEFKSLKNAQPKFEGDPGVRVDTAQNQIARGQSRYGSANA